MFGEGIDSSERRRRSFTTCPLRTELSPSCPVAVSLRRPCRNSHARFLLAQRGEVDVELRLTCVRLDAELVSGVLAEPLHVFDQVGRNVGHVLREMARSRTGMAHPHQVAQLGLDRVPVRLFKWPPIE